MPPTLLQRQWLGVAHQARRALGLPPGEEPLRGVGFVAMLWREGWKALRQAVVVSVGLVPVVMFIELRIPAIPISHSGASRSPVPARRSPGA